MSQPTSRNRLDEEESPYLRQHADNPVNWQPWDEQALAAADEHDVPIFLSVGYSACHWCHVMEEESFEDEAVAALLNDHFVPIKVDREERPDVDSVYMTICQQVTGRGGWPLSVWLTPDGDPFYVGTYFPPEPRQGQPGFRQLLTDITESWADPDERADLEERAATWTAAIEDELEDVPDQPGAPDPGLLDSAATAAVRGADRDHGGWGPGPKFPHPGRLQLLLRAHGRRADDDSRAVLTETLDAMADGGMYDHLGGGFHRYATDRDWTVPHFEKMLYDNAELTRAYLAGYQLIGDERYRAVASDTLAFVAAELRHPDGGFFSTLDARSDTPAGESEEGAYYVWTPSQVASAMRGHLGDGTDPDLAADLFCEHFGVTETGNFEGATVLTRAKPVGAIADERGLAADDVATTLEAARAAARQARDERARPRRDEKVLAGWNGLMVSAFAEAGLVLEEVHTDTAVAALEFVRERLWDADAGRLHRRYKDGDVQVQGYLEDYAFLARGALDCYQATGEVDHLAFALDLARAVEAEFWDADAGTLYFTPESGEALVARPQELDDSSTPSSAGVATQVLATLSHFVTHDRFREIAETVVATHGSELGANPLRHASLTLAADQVATGSLELTLVADEPPAEWEATLAERFLPDRLLAWRPADADAFADWLERLTLPAAPPIWADRDARDGEPTVYACRSFTCSPPTHDLDSALSWAGEQLQAGE
jgi:hypothetical protein